MRKEIGELLPSELSDPQDKPQFVRTGGRSQVGPKFPVFSLPGKRETNKRLLTGLWASLGQDRLPEEAVLKGEQRER